MVRIFFGDDFARAAALAARAHRYLSAEKAVAHVLHAPRAVTFVALLYARTVLCARAVAVRTALKPVELDFLACAECRLQKAHVHAARYVAAARRLTLRTRGRTRTAAHKAAENIENILEAGCRKTSARTSEVEIFKIHFAAVVLAAALRVSQNFIRFVAFLEFFRALLVIGMQVGMVLLCHLAVRRLDFVLRSGFGYA